jgi:hypothetical protein
MPLNRHTRTADIIPGHLEKRNETKHWNGLAQLQGSSFYAGRQIPKAADEGRRPRILRVPGLVIRRPHMVTHGEGREDAPNVSAEDGMENTACCLELQKEEC